MGMRMRCAAYVCEVVPDWWGEMLGAGSEGVW